jgi:outer membrane receptor protein involved in Fe transport
VFSINSNHNLRLTYNEAFQVANDSEFFLRAPVAPSADLSALEGLCLLSGVTDCGLASPVPVLAVGNDDLEVEEIRNFEVGYTGIFGGKTFVTLDAYASENSNFITDLVPNLGTPLGRVNPDFGPWVGSGAISGDAEHWAA